MAIETVDHQASGVLPINRLPLILLGLLAALAVLMLVPGHLAATNHVIDIMHATSIVFRMVEGQQQHIDFMTPLGIMTTAPIAWLVQAGLDISRAYLAAGVLVTLALMPATLRVATSRLSPGLGLAFGIGMVILTTSLVYGGDNPGISISMFYNRWAWAAASIIILLLVLPPNTGTERPAIDSAIIGLLLGYLVLLKLTYFVALAPVVAVGFAMRRDWSNLLYVGLAGLAVALLATVAFGGIAFWTAYANDILMVTASENRAYPGLEFHGVISAPSMLPATFCALLLVVVLRMSGADQAGLLMLLLLPAFAYITFQNWGNDPKWLFLIGVIALATKPLVAGQRVMRTEAPFMLTLIATAALTFIAPSAINLVVSPFRNLVASSDAYVEILSDPAHAGLLTTRTSAFGGKMLVEIPGTRDPLKEDAKPNEISFGGVEIADCSQQSGYVSIVQEIARDLTANGYAGQSLYFADIYDPLPLVGDFPFTPGRAPWHYGGAVPIDGTTALVVPKCGGSGPSVRSTLEDLQDDGPWTLVADRQHHWIFKRR